MTQEFLLLYRLINYYEKIISTLTELLTLMSLLESSHGLVLTDQACFYHHLIQKEKKTEKKKKKNTGFCVSLVKVSPCSQNFICFLSNLTTTRRFSSSNSQKKTTITLVSSKCTLPSLMIPSHHSSIHISLPCTILMPL